MLDGATLKVGAKVQREGKDGVWRDATIVEHNPSTYMATFYFDSDPSQKFFVWHGVFRRRAIGQDYPNGIEQYEVDVKLLTEAGVLADGASGGGDWEYGWATDNSKAQIQTVSNKLAVLFPEIIGLPVLTALNKNDAELVLNAGKVALAAGRFVSWALSKLEA